MTNFNSYTCSWYMYKQFFNNFFVCIGHLLKSSFHFRTKSLSQHKVILYTQLDNVPNPVKIAKVRKDNSQSVWSLCTLWSVSVVLRFLD